MTKYIHSIFFLSNSENFFKNRLSRGQSKISPSAPGSDQVGRQEKNVLKEVSVKSLN